MNRLLLIDDDQELVEMLSMFLQREGFQVDSCTDPRIGLQQVQSHPYDLLILDVMMPGLDGITLLRHLRHVSNLPVIMLTARGEGIDRVMGLELGADDYLAKPCLPQELVARIRSVLRRVQPAPQALRVQEGGLVLSAELRTAYLHGELINLTGAEFNVLWLLMSQAGQLVSKDELSITALGRPLSQFDRSIDVHISNIRQKLGPRPDGLSWIESVRGKGYQLLRSRTPV
jgi:DNA-binding response OmpR family regulator